MFYKKEQDDLGDYADEQGNRYRVTFARRIRCAQGVNVGYEEFPSLADALAAWGLLALEE